MTDTPANHVATFALSDALGPRSIGNGQQNADPIRYPEPGGLSWYEMLALLRAVISKRRVVGCDLVELCPIPGIVGPNFLCAKLIYKILTYQFAK